MSKSRSIETATAAVAFKTKVNKALKKLIRLLRLRLPLAINYKTLRPSFLLYVYRVSFYYDFSYVKIYSIVKSCFLLLKININLARA